MNYMKKVKYRRYMSVIKACKFMRKKDKSFFGINRFHYSIKINLIKFDKLVKRVNSYLDLLTTLGIVKGYNYETKRSI